MGFDFHKLTWDDKKIYEKYAPERNGFLGWEYNFSMTWIWNVFNETKIFDAGDAAFVATKFYDRCVFYPPMLTDPSALPHAVRLIEDECARYGCEMDLRGLLKEQAEMLDVNRYEITTDRGTADYIYAADDLLMLAGKKFHGKRNHAAKFYKSYAYEFRPYDVADRAGILDLYKKWDTHTAHETLDLEEQVIVRALDAAVPLGLKIGVLTANGRIAAFSISAVDTPYIGHTFIEKADTELDGAYQAVNQKTAEAFFREVPYINRQEDMNIEGIRKAKLSYHPVQILEKYRVQLKK